MKPSSSACPQWHPPRVAAPVALASARRMVTRAPCYSGPPTGLPSWPPLALTCARGPRWRCCGRPVHCRVA
eukprot:8109875-Pyramimonas_sp.AAC.1